MMGHARRVGGTGEQPPLPATRSIPAINQAPPSPRVRFVVCFDWDDTLFPTTWLTSWVPDPVITVVQPTILRALSQIEAPVLALLKRAVFLGHVVIVTNAEEGWVEGLCHRFFPSLFAFVQRHVTILSARSLFGASFPGNPVEWKARTFQQAVRNAPIDRDALESPPVLVSIGDSDIERRAASIAVMRLQQQGYGSICFRSLKFIDTPLLGQLRAEVRKAHEVLEDFGRLVTEPLEFRDVVISAEP